MQEHRSTKAKEQLSKPVPALLKRARMCHEYTYSMNPPRAVDESCVYGVHATRWLDPVIEEVPIEREREESAYVYER